MNATTVRELSVASITGTLSFPEIVARLISEGIEYYHVDYAALQFTFYGGAGEVIVAPLAFEGLPVVGQEFKTDELRAAILDSQRNRQKFRDFSRRAMQAGVQSYFAFLLGKRVTYLGRQGEQHVEWFPGAAPPLK